MALILIYYSKRNVFHILKLVVQVLYFLFEYYLFRFLQLVLAFLYLIIKFKILSKIPKFEQNNLKLIIIRNLFNLLCKLTDILMKDFGIETLKINKDKVLFCIYTEIRLPVYSFRIVVLSSTLERCPLSFLNLCVERSCWLIFDFIILTLFLLFNWLIRFFVCNLNLVEVFMQVNLV